MKRVIEFKQGDSVIFVEVDDTLVASDQLSSRSGAADKAKQTFEDAVAGIGPIAATILRQVAALAPESVSVEFGIKFSAQAGVIIASSALESNCKITLGWKPRTDSA
jgi:NTP-dependent ternary system trypsin peptidase co-occuring protein